MKQKTAIQELIDFLEPELKMHDFLQLPAYEKALSLLEKEKQQIMDAYDAGNDFDGDWEEEENYYKETFGDNTEAGI